ncbi:MAG: M20/M25/M40 family metallo-hydrolase [Candidatus Tectomicrobia bacterium]|nr:M20/M25/M40 family metallo-hydrolase [Candidatus Tectomicrobia bacterium]
MSSDKSLDAVFAHIDAHAGKTVEDLCELCRQPSVSTTHVGVMEMARLLQERLERTGFKTQRFETTHNPIIYGELKGGAQRTLLYYNHYDVQPPDPLEEWVSPPFEPTIRDGHVYARGATDNKGNIMSRLAAIEAFLAVRGQLPCTVKYMIEGNEEMSSPVIGPFVDGHKGILQADACIWEDSFAEHVPVLSLGNKGILYIEMRCRTANVDFHSSNAQIYENAAWRLVWALSTMKDRDENILVEGFYDDVAPLTDREKEILARVPPYDGAHRREKFQIRRFLLDLPDDKLPERHLTRPTLNIAGIWGGYTGKGRKTIVTGQATAKVDCRLVANQDPQKIMACIRRHLDKHGFGDIEIANMGHGSFPSKSDPGSDIVKACVRACRRVYGQDPPINPFGTGSTPVWSVIRHLKIPVVSTGVGKLTARTHSANENIKIEHLTEGAKYMAAILEEFSRP